MSRLDEKHKLLGNFEKILKIFDENSIEKLNFYFYLGKFVTKNRAFGNNTIFLQRFFGFGFPPPGYALGGVGSQWECKLEFFCRPRWMSDFRTLHGVSPALRPLCRCMIKLI